MKQLFTILVMISFLSKLFGGELGTEYKTAEIYRAMRQQIFDLPKEKIDLGSDDRLAILMETGLEDACYSLVAVTDGSASLYFSNGGGIIGAGQHPEGASAAKAFLAFSSGFEEKLSKTKEYPLPRRGMTRFYIIKKDCVLSGEFKEDDLGNGRLSMSPLFHKAHELIATIRTIEEQRKGEPPAGGTVAPDMPALP